MRTTVTLDDDVAEAAKALAQVSGRTLGQALSELARNGLRAGRRTKSAKGLPTFEVEDPSEVIPATRATKLLSEEP
jgi:hypothetical protein